MINYKYNKIEQFLEMFTKFVLAQLLFTLTSSVSYSYIEMDGRATVVGDGDSFEVKWLHDGEVYRSKEIDVAELKIFCHCGARQALIAMWRSVYLEIRKTMEYTLFEGDNATNVAEQYKSHISSWLPLLPWRQSVVALPAFSNHCIGITSLQSFELHLIVRRINYWKILQFLAGITLFFLSPTLSRNVFFYYGSGVSFGVLASLLILVYIVSRLIPKKTGAYSIVILGWSMVLYLLQLIWSNLRTIIEKYQNLLLGYIAVSALISFAVCYRYGPMTDLRTKKLIQWSLQLIGLVLIFFSSELRELSMAFVILTVTVHNFPTVWIAKLQNWWLFKFPPKVKFLTEEEYLEQSAVHTRKSLEELRKFCHSPDCNAWKTMCHLKDPIRFANFVEGESHLTDDEILNYESGPTTPISSLDFTDDETDEEVEALNTQIRNWIRPK